MANASTSGDPGGTPNPKNTSHMKSLRSHLMDQRGQRGAFFFSPGWTAEDRARHKHSLPGYQCSTVGVTPFKTRKSGRQKGRHTECQAGFWIEGGDSSEKKKNRPDTQIAIVHAAAFGTAKSRHAEESTPRWRPGVNHSLLNDRLCGRCCTTFPTG